LSPIDTSLVLLFFIGALCARAKIATSRIVKTENRYPAIELAISTTEFLYYCNIRIELPFIYLMAKRAMM